MADLFYYRSIAYAETGDLESAETDLQIMNEKRQQLTYRSGEAIHDLAWLRLGDFYRERLQDENKALEAYQNVIDRTTWTFWGRPPKPVARGADATLERATEAAADILRRKGREDEIPALQLNLLQARAEAAAAILETDAMLARFEEFLALSGRFTPEMAALESRIQSLGTNERDAVIEGIGKLTEGMTDDTRDLLIETGRSDDAAQGKTALRTLLVFSPEDKVGVLLGETEEEARMRSVREDLEPSVERMREKVQEKQWRELVDEFKDKDFASWEDNALAGEAFALRGQAYANLEDAAKAEPDLKQAVELGRSGIWYQLAELYSNLGEEDRALDAYLKMIEEIGPDRGWLSYDTVLKAAAILQNQDRNDEALKLLKMPDPERLSQAGIWNERIEAAIERTPKDILDRFERAVGGE